MICLAKKINFSLFYVKVIVFVLLKDFIYVSKIIIILSIYSRLFVENRLTMIAVLFFLFRIQQHLRCALILYLSSTRLTTHSLSFFPIFKHMGQEVGLSLPEIYVLLQCQPSKTTYTYTAVSFFQIKHSISGHLVSLFSTDVQL